MFQWVIDDVLTTWPGLFAAVCVVLLAVATAFSKFDQVMDRRDRERKGQ